MTLLLTIASIIGAYLVAESVYKREQRDKKAENKELENSENELLKNNLEEIKKPILKQINSLKEYIIEKDFHLFFHSEIQVDFLQFISVKDIYKKHGLNYHSFRTNKSGNPTHPSPLTINTEYKSTDKLIMSIKFTRPLEGNCKNMF